MFNDLLQSMHVCSAVEHTQNQRHRNSQHQRQRQRQPQRQRLQRQSFKCKQIASRSCERRLHKLQRQQHNRLIIFLIALIMLQQMELHACRQISKAARALTGSLPQTSLNLHLDAPTDQLQPLTAHNNVRQGSHYRSADDFSMAKRGSVSGGVSGVVVSDASNDDAHHAGQPEEIFAVDDARDTNYDEYPMIVPKRAALLLDRLMVALHRALEKEQDGQHQRIGDFYSKNKDFGIGLKPHTTIEEKSNRNIDILNGMQSQSQMPDMYSDDDPSAFMDYDFKDLSSVNRATGETLMAKSFQRRGNMASVDGFSGGGIGGGGGGSGGGSRVGGGGKSGGKGEISALLTTAIGRGSSSAGSDNLLAGSSGNAGVRRVNLGRVYWRCYFNAVSCF